MTESKKRNETSDGDLYSMALTALVFLGLAIKIPFILSVIVQGCLAVCALDVAYRHLRNHDYARCLIILSPLLLIGLFDPVVYNL